MPKLKIKNTPMNKNEIPQGEVAQLAATLDLIEKSKTPLDAETLDMVENARTVVLFLDRREYPRDPEKLVNSIRDMQYRVLRAFSAKHGHPHPVEQSA
jgi:hypothetical protein